MPTFFTQTIEFNDGKKAKSDGSAIAEEDNESDSGILECAVKQKEDVQALKSEFTFEMQELD